MYIPDPIELMNAQIEGQMSLVDENGQYPCCQCGVTYNIDDMICATSHPASFLICINCMEHNK